jgi:hexosaminidase
VDDENILSVVFPRTAAVAERLWSPQTVTDLQDAEQRLFALRCRLVARGIPSAPVEAGYCAVQYV